VLASDAPIDGDPLPQYATVCAGIGASTCTSGLFGGSLKCEMRVIHLRVVSSLKLACWDLTPNKSVPLLNRTLCHGKPSSCVDIDAVPGADGPNIPAGPPKWPLRETQPF
jgi:hypothetical protein